MNNEVLRLSRIAAHVMTMLVREFGIGQQAEGFTGDDPDGWLVVSPSEVRCIVHNRCIAELRFNYHDSSPLPYSVNVLVPDCYHLIRSQHLREFDPSSHDIRVNSHRDWTGADQPDIDVTMELQDIETAVPGFLLPRRYIPKRQQMRKIKVKGSL